MKDGESVDMMFLGFRAKISRREKIWQLHDVISLTATTPHASKYPTYP
jgi:hypothetical protein